MGSDSRDPQDALSEAAPGDGWDPGDDRPPICPACGVTMGLVQVADGTTRPACLECDFSDEPPGR